MRVQSWLLFLILCLAEGLSLAQSQPPPKAGKHASGEEQRGASEKSAQEHAGHIGMGESESDPIMDHSHASSGTAWQPLSLPMHMFSRSAGGWLLMAHGNAFITYNQQGGPRGVGKFESTNWLMLMQQRRLGPGKIQFRQMFSAEPGTAPPGGFPQLFQTGETYKGLPLIDRQHPHDVFGELTVLYSLPLSERVSWMFYGGPAGEPAFGPVAYVHRWSASELGAAPLSHHLQDSTHISYGVVTTGVVFKAPNAGSLRLEGSAFNGREPDEKRYTIDFAPLESFSGRITYDPGRNWSMQYSYAHLVKPEALEADNMNRQTASIMYNRPRGSGDNWTTALIWGRNHKLLERTVQNSYVLESVFQFKRKNYAFTRMELVDKDELFPEEVFPSVDPALERNFRLGAYTFGGTRDIAETGGFQLGLGADLTFYSKSSLLDPIYGENPVSFRIFLRLRPSQKQHSAM
ncbi:MAG: hypothetical protein L0Z53_03245 [Acidobacteriales bacterium]|nr:hypothetical protein [Terriglobales bacterium]